MQRGRRQRNLSRGCQTKGPRERQETTEEAARTEKETPRSAQETESKHLTSGRVDILEQYLARNQRSVLLATAL